MIFLLFNDLLPNIVMSRDADIMKIVNITKFPIKFQEHLPDLVLL